MMKRHRNGSKSRRRAIQPWTHEQAVQALPYIRSITASLREHYLEARFHKRRANQLADKPRCQRDELIALEEATRAAQRAQQQFDDTLDELHCLDVYLLDPLRGLAFIPFVHTDQLAWFLFDLFDSQPLRYWRYHEDTLDTRRPIAEIGQEPLSESRII
ncbi:MAG: DUF2203 family protein [Gemmataceae bacterium]